MSAARPQQGDGTSDIAILDILRKKSELTVSQIAVATGVTATAVRQRLNRLMGKGLVDRVATRAGRGRPAHHYRLTEKGRRQSGSNFADLAIALWHEIRSVEDPKVRRGLLERLAIRLAEMYDTQVQGESIAERLESLTELFDVRSIPMVVQSKDGSDGSGQSLHIVDCPYPVLSEQDRSICALEQLLFSRLTGGRLKLTQCRLDGASCCTFETN
jgi:predicted ArsR family transcriptional regulator